MTKYQYFKILEQANFIEKFNKGASSALGYLSKFLYLSEEEKQNILINSLEEINKTSAGSSRSEQAQKAIEELFKNKKALKVLKDYYGDTDIMLGELKAEFYHAKSEETSALSQVVHFDLDYAEKKLKSADKDLKTSKYIKNNAFKDLEYAKEDKIATQNNFNKAQENFNKAIKSYEAAKSDVDGAYQSYKAAEAAKKEANSKYKEEHNKRINVKGKKSFDSRKHTAGVSNSQKELDKKMKPFNDNFNKAYKAYKAAEAAAAKAAENYETAKLGFDRAKEDLDFVWNSKYPEAVKKYEEASRDFQLKESVLRDTRIEVEFKKKEAEKADEIFSRSIDEAEKVNQELESIKGLLREEIMFVIINLKNKGFSNVFSASSYDG